MADPVIRGGGPKRYLHHLLLLANHGVKIIILINENIVTNGTLNAAGLSDHRNICIEIITRQKTRPVGGWALAFRSAVARQRTRLLRHHPDIILIYGSCNLLAAVALKRAYQVPLLFDPRDNPVAALQIIITHERSFKIRAIYLVRKLKERYFERLMQKNVDHYFFQTNLEAESYQQRIRLSAQQYTVLPNSVRSGIASHAISPTTTDEKIDTANSIEHHIPKTLSRVGSEHTDDALRTVLFCGALTPLKAAHTLVQAVDLLQQKKTSVHLYIAGTGSEEVAIREYIRERCLKNVSMLGWVSTPETLLRAVDLLVVPSLHDALPDVLLEAFTAGTAAIGSDIAGIRVAISDQRFLFEPGSVEAIAEKIYTLQTDSDLFRAARDNSKKRYSQYDFDWVQRFMMHIRDI